MKKIVIIFILLLQISPASVLKGSVDKEYIPEGFFGSWAVLSKLNSTNNPSLFKNQAKDVWTLSGYGKTLILENYLTGARSEINVKNKPQGTKVSPELKFKRTNTVEKDGLKIVYKETVAFTLLDEKFEGYDDYVVEKYKKGKMIEKSHGKYLVYGKKFY